MKGLIPYAGQEGPTRWLAPQRKRSRDQLPLTIKVVMAHQRRGLTLREIARRENVGVEVVHGLVCDWLARPAA